MCDPIRSDDIRQILDDTISEIGSDVDVDDILSDRSLTDYSSGSDDNYQPNLDELDTSDDDNNVNRPGSPRSNSQSPVRPVVLGNNVNPWVRVYPPEPEKDVASNFKVRSPGISDCPPGNKK